MIDNGSATGSTPSTEEKHGWTKGEVWEHVKTLALFLAVAFLLRASVVQAFKIPSSSMEPTLQIGDHIFVNKLSYGLRLPFLSETVWQYGAPDRGDIVVFTLPDDPYTSEDEGATNIIKRVAGIPGDKIEVRSDQVLINGHVNAEISQHARWLRGGAYDYGPVTVPEGHIFLLGDNRDHSKDSRFWDNPFLDVRRVDGRAFIIYWNSRFMLRRILTVLQ